MGNVTETQEQKDMRLRKELERACSPFAVLRPIAYVAILKALRDRGVIIEPPPLPEKTYTVTLTQVELGEVINACVVNAGGANEPLNRAYRKLITTSAERG